MRFVKLTNDIHLNLDAVLLIGTSEDGDVQIIGHAGNQPVLFTPDGPGLAVLMAAVEAYSDTSFYDAAQKSQV